MINRRTRGSFGKASKPIKYIAQLRDLSGFRLNALILIRSKIHVKRLV